MHFSILIDANDTKIIVVSILVFIFLTVTACGKSDTAPVKNDATATFMNRGGRIERRATVLTNNPAPTTITLTQSLKSSAPHPTLSAMIPNSARNTITGTPTPDSVELCSPLHDHLIQELQEFVSAPYDPPPPGKEQRHHGVDFSYYQRGERQSIQGVGVQSVLPGVVAAAISESFPYGNFVIIETPFTDVPSETREQLEIKEGESLYLLYAHMEDSPLVNLGDRVAACQLLGSVGKSGNAGIPHLHLEARTGPSGAVFEAMAYYTTRTTEEERSNYELWRTSGEFVHFDPMLLFLSDK